MDNEQELKLQAFFDGELPEAEAREVASWLARDADATALHTELKNTRKALEGFERGVALPETREFFWSKVQREIEKSAPAPQPVEPSSIFRLLRRWILSAGAVAVVVIAGLIATQQFGGTAVSAVTVTELADSGAMTFHDYESGTTLVWFSYPADDHNPEKTTTIQ